MEKNWLDRKEYPFDSRFIDIDGQRMHYIDEGDGDVVLFVHGTPSWSFDFRNVIKQLRNDYRCIALDHIGFGLSDKAENYAYSTPRHSKNLGHFIAKLGLDKFTLVVHDFGGPIALNYAIKNATKIHKLVILNSWLWSSENDPEYIRVRKILSSPLLPFLYRNLNFSARYILPKSFGDKKLSKSMLKQYTRPFANRKQRNGTLAFAKSLLNDQTWFEELWSHKQSIIRKPTLFLWGMKDPVVKPHNLYKFQSAFQNSSTLELENCGHFPQEESPSKVTEAIMKFLSE